MTEGTKVETRRAADAGAAGSKLCMTPLSGRPTIYGRAARTIPDRKDILAMTDKPRIADRHAAHAAGLDVAMTDEANTRPQAGMDPPYCEICGEALATVSLADVGACNDCAEGEFQRELEPLLGYRPCATIIWPRKDMPALCLVRAGIEHDHA